MKTQSYRSFIAVLLIGFFATACQTKTTKNTDNEIEFTTINVEKTYHLLGNKDNPNCDLQLTFTYPVKYTNKEILQKIQILFISSYFGEAYETFSPEEAASKYTEDYLESYKELEEDYVDELKNAENAPVGSWYSYYESSSNEIAFNMDNILSYTVNFENYTGGAHGAHSAINQVIDLKNGVLVKESDIFVEGFEDKLAALLVEDIAKQNNLENAKELEKIGFFSIDEIYPNGNFMVDDKGITYSFNEYEIAAYVVGITNVNIPYEKIQHLLRKESPISQLFTNS